MPRRGSKPTTEFDTMPYRDGKVRFTLFICRHCPRAWKLADPVESWRIKTLLTHAQSHRVNNAAAEIARYVGDEGGRD